MTVLGLNAGNVPAQVGDLLGSVGSAGNDVIAGVSDIAGGLNIGNVTQASMLGGLTSSISSSNPIFVSGGAGLLSGNKPFNVAKTRTARSNGLGSSPLNLKF